MINQRPDHTLIWHDTDFRVLNKYTFQSVKGLMKSKLIAVEIATAEVDYIEGHYHLMSTGNGH